MVNGVLFLDLKKAFDTVDHKILLPNAVLHTSIEDYPGLQSKNIAKIIFYVVTTTKQKQFIIVIYFFVRHE